jgi:hypothetical protein
MNSWNEVYVLIIKCEKRYVLDFTEELLDSKGLLWIIIE